MAIIWTKDDETGIEALKYIEANGGCARIVSKGAKNVVLEFDVIDEWKASSFLMDLLHLEKLQEITGIRVNSIGYPYKAAADQIKEHIDAINALLSHFGADQSEQNNS